MFTGIITDVGRIRSVERRADTRIVIGTDYDVASIEIGGSIACSGACLTVVDKGSDRDGAWFAVDVSEATMAVTALGDLRPGSSVNLERSLRVGDELGGHIVTGHVDAVGALLSIESVAGSKRVRIELPEGIARFVAAKGSITAQGVSLTVNSVGDGSFEVNMIPHTLEKTTFARAVPGDRINLEIDILARYLARLSQAAA